MSTCTRCGQEITSAQSVQYVNPGQANPDNDVTEMAEADMEPQHVECPT